MPFRNALVGLILIMGALAFALYVLWKFIVGAPVVYVTMSIIAARQKALRKTHQVRE